jgi:arogenate dehydrogenase (NADP+)
MAIIGLVGLGLIGGSLGLDFRSSGHRVLGVSRQQSTCERALVKGVVDKASQDLALLKNCEVVFICTPIPLVLPTLEKLQKVLSPQTIITDVASVKGPIVGAATAQWPRFVGGHPMAGTAHQGVEAAEAGLFHHRPYALTPLATTDTQALDTVHQLVLGLGSKLVVFSPEVHDQLVAQVSHLPVMVSAALLLSVGDIDKAQQLAGPGFQDTSRVGGGNPDLGLAMAQHNRTAILESLKQFRAALDHLEEQIQQQDWEGLQAQLESSRQIRTSFFPS